MNATTKPDGEFEAALSGYLCDLRDRVCSLCGGRPVGDPRGNPCGTVLLLEQLVDALNEPDARGDRRPPRPWGGDSHPAPARC